MSSFLVPSSAQGILMFVQTSLMALSWLYLGGQTEPEILGLVDGLVGLCRWWSGGNWKDYPWLSSNCGLNLPIMMRGGAGAASTASLLQSPRPGRLCRGKTKISDEAGTFTTAVIVRDGPQQKSTLCNYIMKWVWFIWWLLLLSRF